MNQTEKLEQILGRVGLLRAQFSKIMKIIHERREFYKTQHRYPPHELSSIMANTQEHFAELLKASDFISTAMGNIEVSNEDRFNNCLDEWIVTQTRERLEGIKIYIQELKRLPAEKLVIDLEELEKVFFLVDETFEFLN